MVLTFFNPLGPGAALGLNQATPPMERCRRIMRHHREVHPAPITQLELIAEQVLPPGLSNFIISQPITVVWLGLP